jgi:hypothetical protein
MLKQMPSLDQYHKCFIEKQGVIDSSHGRWRKNAGGGNEGKSHYVVEKTWRKDVSFMACHYVDENKLVIVFLPLC